MMHLTPGIQGLYVLSAMYLLPYLWPFCKHNT